MLRLPDGAVCLASGSREPHHAFKLGAAAWGIQFHPEFDAEVVRKLDAEESRESPSGVDTDAAIQPIRETPESGRILGRFAEIVSGTANRS